MRRPILAGLVALLVTPALAAPGDAWEPVKKEVVDTANWQRVLLSSDKILVYLGRGETEEHRLARLGVSWGQFEAKIVDLLKLQQEGELENQSADVLVTELLDVADSFDQATGERFKFLHQALEPIKNLQDSMGKALGLLDILHKAYDILSVDPNDPIAVAGALQQYLELAAQLTGEVFPPAGIYLQTMSAGLKNTLPLLKIIRDRTALTNKAVDTWMDETETFVVDFQQFSNADAVDQADPGIVALAQAQPKPGTNANPCEVKEANDIAAINQKLEAYAAERTDDQNRVIGLFFDGSRLQEAIPWLQARVAEVQAQVDANPTPELLDQLQHYQDVLAIDLQSYETVTRALVYQYELGIKHHLEYLRTKQFWIRQVQTWRRNEDCDQPWLAAYAAEVDQAIAVSPYIIEKK